VRFRGRRLLKVRADLVGREVELRFDPSGGKAAGLD
jgi:hypothetical protein